MKVTTNNGKELTLSTGDYKGSPTIIFGSMPWSYLMATILESQNCGLLLDGGSNTSISASELEKAKAWIMGWMDAQGLSRQDIEP